MRKLAIVSLLLALLPASQAGAVTGEMGTGIPNIILITQPYGSRLVLWLTDATVPMPASCPTISISPGTVGERDYQFIHSMLLSAKAVNKRLRFYAIVERDGGCGVDYVAWTE